MPDNDEGGRMRRWWFAPQFSRFTVLWMGVLAFIVGVAVTR
jgi:hypothetical protein